jgi:transcriptional regulator GlxA family with amidase domain
MGIMPDFRWRICARHSPITDDRGLGLMVDSVAEPMDGYDLLFVPGGLGTRTLQHDPEFVEWLRSAAPAKLKISVCTGSLLLGAAGFLKSRKATTHPLALKELKPYCDTVLNLRLVDDRSVITAGGVSASLDLGLHIVQRLAGAEARSLIANQMDYPYRSANF